MLAFCRRGEKITLTGIFIAAKLRIHLSKEKIDMTKEQRHILDKRMNEAPQYVKYFMLDTLLNENEQLVQEIETLKKQLEKVKEENSSYFSQLHWK